MNAFFYSLGEHTPAEIEGLRVRSSHSVKRLSDQHRVDLNSLTDVIDFEKESA